MRDGARHLVDGYARAHRRTRDQCRDIGDERGTAAAATTGRSLGVSEAKIAEVLVVLTAATATASEVAATAATAVRPPRDVDDTGGASIAAVSTKRSGARSSICGRGSDVERVRTASTRSRVGSTVTAAPGEGRFGATR
jgi:hypothetical protein